MTYQPNSGVSNPTQDHLIIVPPKRITALESWKLFIWNKESKEFLGRTSLSWAKILSFYTVFYACLIAFCSVIFLIFFQTLDSNQPKWQNANGLIGSNPGLGLRPMPSDHSNNLLIEIKHGKDGNLNYWSTELEKFLRPYNNTVTKNGSLLTSCSFNNLPLEGKVCSFDIQLLGTNCTKENNFGYGNGQPCIFIKLNRIIGWIPELYNDPTESMPADLKQYIIENKDSREKLETIWLSCEGEGLTDKENIGNVTYTPMPGFPGYYFPYKNIPDYSSPLVAVQFQNPKVGVLIRIECKAWAKNIIHDRQRRLGSVHFQLLIG